MLRETLVVVRRRIEKAFNKSRWTLIGLVALGTVSGIALGVTMPPAAETDSTGFVHWPAAQLRGYAKKLAPKINAGKVASDQLGKFGNHSMIVIHREGDGEAEVHESQADVFVVQSGEATLVLGGEMVNGKTTAPGEVRGPSIQGGVRKRLAAGDIVHISARLPHQLLIEPGKQFNYVVVKVDSPPTAATTTTTTSAMR